MKIRNMFKKEYKIGEIFLNEINEISINLTLDLSINNEYDEIMRLYGNNLKMYNIIKKYKESPSTLEQYLQKTKKKLKII
jgi:RNase P/RNase MRP subunit p30